MKKILIYNGLGHRPNSFKGIYNTIKKLVVNYEIKSVTSEDIVSKNILNKANLFIMPGGRDVPYCHALNGKGNDLIKMFVKNGGNYLGICAGAYYGSSYCEFDKHGDVQVVGKRELGFFPGKAIGPIIKKYDYNSYKGSCAAIINTNIVELDHKKIRVFITVDVILKLREIIKKRGL